MNKNPSNPKHISLNQWKQERMRKLVIDGITNIWHAVDKGNYHEIPKDLQQLLRLPPQDLIQHLNNEYDNSQNPPSI